MKQVARVLSTYSADLFGICSVLYELGGLVEMHDAYKSLGGNGLIDKMYKDMKKLNFKRKEDTNYGNI